MIWDIVGFSISLIIGGIVVWLVIDKWLLKRIKFLRPDLLLVTILGGMERVIYTLCIIFEAPTWIAVWLAFKVLTRWRYLDEHGPDEHRKLSVSLGNIYLIGNLLTIVFGVVGGLICKYGFHIKEWSLLFK